MVKSTERRGFSTLNTARMSLRQDFRGYKDMRTVRYQFWRRLYEYGASNLQFGIYYDKVFRKEYLPSRIRYNQFFFFAFLGCFLFNLHSRHWSFTNEKEKSLGLRKYFTIGRPFENFIMRAVD